MAKNKITVGIDLGTASTRVVVLSWQSDSQTPEVVSSVSVPSKGMRHGYIVNTDDVTNSIKKAVSIAEKESGISIRRATFSIGGTSLSAETGQGSAIISKADGEITSFDSKSALESAEENIDLKNKKVIYTSPISWKLDGKEINGKPEGMFGIKLEVKVLYITCLSQHLDDLLLCASSAGVEVLEVFPSSIAASNIALSDRQKTVGVMLVNIGAETVSIAIFENGVPIGFSVFPIGSTDITNDIALGFRITLEEAESIKTGNIIATNYPKRRVDEIIEARLSDIFDLVDGYLKKIRRSGLLPAGVVITGGGGGHSLVEGLAKNMLRLPSKVGSDELLSQIRGNVRDSSWFVAYGLAIMAHTSANSKSMPQGNSSGIFKEFFRQFLP